jgi:RNA polymerase sigma-70 factor, ECF subfamily
MTFMLTTSISLLNRLQQESDPKSWDRFVELYTPLFHSWTRGRLGLQECDAFDLVQDIFLILSRKLADFDYDKAKSFRGWLWTLARNKYLEKRRKPVEVQLGSDAGHGRFAEVDGAEVFAEEEYRKYLVQRALQLMQAEFQPTTWKACWEFVVNGKSAAIVAGELGTSVEVVWAAKSRVLRRLREELAHLLT